ncbi:SH3 domain-containing protein [Streptomyces sp. MI02-7b]|uniref:SH3 domain-containing protein n=1 Tax=Streptomyces sp. MI02-7b TaxID=462941 RepID=UPI0029A693E1|nr:SH3 domain-containing protein [Streptomyces sp. MI02-7b]MDX3076587.1 SH3 domain-containing protein [Streptomyces sp. MI02-7b]
MAENSLDVPAEAGGARVAGAATTGLVYYQVAPDCRLNVRSGPGTSYQIVRTLPTDARVPIFCQTTGTNVTGYYGTSNIWDRIGPDQYVSDAYVHTGSDGFVTSRC